MKISLLIVDDELPLQRMLKIILTCISFNIGTAVNGDEAIQKIRQKHFDLILTDATMPGLHGGNNLLYYAKYKTDKPIPVIGMSNGPCLVRGNDFDGILVKPFTFEKSIFAICKVLKIEIAI